MRTLKPVDQKEFGRFRIIVYALFLLTAVALWIGAVM